MFEPVENSEPVVQNMHDVVQNMHYDITGVRSAKYAHIDKEEKKNKQFIAPKTDLYGVYLKEKQKIEEKEKELFGRLYDNVDWSFFEDKNRLLDYDSCCFCVPGC